MTEQQWQKIVQEFGDCAFERVDGVGCNDDVDYYLAINDDIGLKPLSALFQHDVSVYGNDAYQMIEISLSDKDRFIDATDNKDVEWALNSTNYDVRRKTSAALPFDLIRAKAGDVVEYKNVYENGYTGLDSIEWVTMQSIVIDDELTISGKFYIDNHLFNIEVNEDEHIEWLRMKYPLKLSNKRLE